MKVILFICVFTLYWTCWLLFFSLHLHPPSAGVSASWLSSPLSGPTLKDHRTHPVIRQNQKLRDAWITLTPPLSLSSLLLVDRWLELPSDCLCGCRCRATASATASVLRPWHHLGDASLVRDTASIRVRTPMRAERTDGEGGLSALCAGCRVGGRSLALMTRSSSACMLLTRMRQGEEMPKAGACFNVPVWVPLSRMPSPKARKSKLFRR